MSFTVLGGSGFIGSHLVAHLRSVGHECRVLGRDYSSELDMPLGHVIYCVGVTGDFRWRPLETVSAHVCHLIALLERGRFDSITYLSSTRVYSTQTSPVSALTVDPCNPDHLYNISKLMGESTCLTRHLHSKVVRVSNVYGMELQSHNFLASIVRSAVQHGRVNLQTTMESARDYVGIDDVVRMLPEIAVRGRRRVYNLAFGTNRTTAELMEALKRETGCIVEVAPDAATIRYPDIDIVDLRQEIGFRPKDVLEALPDLVAGYRKELARDGS
jgi:nucleoside-diphosphate-sugar epimerase